MVVVVVMMVMMLDGDDGNDGDDGDHDDGNGDFESLGQARRENLEKHKESIFGQGARQGR